MISRTITKLFAILALLALAGCADIAPTRREAPVLRAGKTCHPRIALSGRFSVNYQKDGKDESAHGGFRWGQDDSNMRIVLMSPLGDTQATIDVTAESATLTQSGKISRTAEDVDALVLTELGWPLPISGLRDWIQACIHDERGRRVRVTPEGRELSTSDGWRIAYPVWEEGAGGRRPKRIDLHRSERGRADISVRLVIDEWLPRR